MAKRLRVYLAGPIRGCNEEQRTWWREEVKRRLKEFDFEDPTEWADDRGVPREIPKLEACDLVVANMWKESVGTTVGIVRANQQGKPVVLVDPNRANNAILDALVAPEEHVHTLEEACARLRELAAEFKPFTVLKKDGTEERFLPAKVTRSVSLAAAEAGVTDAGFEERISGQVISRLRHDGGQHGLVTTEEIRTALFERLESMHSDFLLPQDMRLRAESVLKAWREKETLKRGEDAIREAKERTRAAEEEAERWKKLFLELRDKGVPVTESSEASQEKTGPKFKSVDQVLNRISKKWRTFLVLHDEAKATARHIKPPLTARGREDLHDLLERLGEFARDRAFAEASNEPLPCFEERFGDGYAPTETKETKGRYRQIFCEFEGKKCFGLQHLKMTSDTGQKIRVYFDELSPSRFLVSGIGHRKTFGHDG